MRALTPQENKFVQEYINKRNGPLAAEKAGVDKRVAGRVAGSWLKDPAIINAINEEIDKSAEKTKLSRDWVLKETKKVYDKAVGNGAIDPAKVRFDLKNALTALSLIDSLLMKIEMKDETGKPAAQINIITDRDDTTFRIM